MYMDCIGENRQITFAEILSSVNFWNPFTVGWADTYWLHSATLTSTENFQKVCHCEISLLSLLRGLKIMSMDLKDSCPPGDREMEAHSSHQAIVCISYKNHGYDNWDCWLTFKLGLLLRSSFRMLNSEIDPFYSGMTKEGSGVCSSSSCTTIRKTSRTQNLEVEEGEETESHVKILCSSAGLPDDLQETSHTWAIGLSCTLHWHIKATHRCRKALKNINTPNDYSCIGMFSLVCHKFLKDSKNHSTPWGT